MRKLPCDAINFKAACADQISNCDAFIFQCKHSQALGALFLLNQAAKQVPVQVQVANADGLRVLSAPLWK